jgi:aspartyl protease family protein
MSFRPIWFLALLGAAIVLVLGLNLAFPGSLGSQDAKIQLAYGLVLLTMLISGLAVASRAHLTHLVKSSLAWIAIALALITLYTYRDGFQAFADNIVATLDPAQPQAEAGMVTIRENSDGHYMANAEVEGVKVRFLIDTGASSVVLTKRDAERIGIDVDSLHYDTPVLTANGQTMVAPVLIRSLKLGPIELRGVYAHVAGDGLDVSLLGMTVLKKLNVEIGQHKLVIRE